MPKPNFDKWFRRQFGGPPGGAKKDPWDLLSEWLTLQKKAEQASKVFQERLRWCAAYDAAAKARNVKWG